MDTNIPRRKRATTFRRAGWLAVASMTTLALFGPAAGAAAGASGAIWTTSVTCVSPAPQDQNLYAVGDTVHIRGSHVDANTALAWSTTGQPGGTSTAPHLSVARGHVTPDAM